MSCGPSCHELAGAHEGPIDKLLIQFQNGRVPDVQVIEEPAAAAVALDPVRSKILAVLAEPGSATTVAKRLDLPRQKVNYHLRLLEAHSLVREVEQRRRRGLTERVVVATASGYVLSSVALGDSAADPARIDRLSSRYLVAVAGRMVAEVASLAQRAQATGKELATLAIDTEIRFASARERAEFTRELTRSVTDLVARYHDERAPTGRWHRLIVAAHPRPAPTEENHA